jgi:hypothetical protein
LNSGLGKLGLRCGGLALFRAVAFCVTLPGLMPTVGAPAYAGAVLEEHELPMHFTWVACEPNCRGWIGAVGIVTGDTPKNFDDFARGRDLGGATIVLDSNGGSVNDAIALGRRWRMIGLRTTVGSNIETHTASGESTSVAPQAWCESMCVFLLLSGKVRYVPEKAHVRVHQIWMGDRAEDAKASTYTAQDVMIVERDIGRLAKYTFDMGGTGDLLSLSLNVPPWGDLHELSQQELQMTNLATTDTVADVLPESNVIDPALASLTPKWTQDRFVGSAEDNKISPVPKSSKTTEVTSPTGGVAAVAPLQNSGRAGARVQICPEAARLRIRRPWHRGVGRPVQVCANKRPHRHIAPSVEKWRREAPPRCAAFPIPAGTNFQR